MVGDSFYLMALSLPSSCHFRKTHKLSTESHTCNSGTQWVKAGRRQVRDHPGLQRERPCQENSNIKKHAVPTEEFGRSHTKRVLSKRTGRAMAPFVPWGKLSGSFGSLESAGKMNKKT